jgi:hypothetical protein
LKDNGCGIFFLKKRLGVLKKMALDFKEYGCGTLKKISVEF